MYICLINHSITKKIWFALLTAGVNKNYNFIIIIIIVFMIMQKLISITQ